MNSDNRTRQIPVQPAESKNTKEALQPSQTSRMPAIQYAQTNPNNAMQQPTLLTQNVSTTSSVGVDTTQAPPPSTSERIRRDFSFAQVLASVFSTITCMILAPKIGLLGGLLGAAIGAGVAAVASQIYKSILSSTTEKIKYKQRQINSLVNHVTRKKNGANSSTLSQGIPSNMTPQMKAMAEQSLVNNLGPVNATSTTTNNTSRVQPTVINPIHLTAHSNDEQTKTQKMPSALKYILVIAGITMLSVALSVGVIDYLTKGEGLGKKPEVIYITKYVTEKDNTQTPAQNNENQQNATQSDDKTNQSDNKSEAKDKSENSEQATDNTSNTNNQTSGSSDQPDSEHNTSNTTNPSSSESNTSESTSRSEGNRSSASRHDAPQGEINS